MDKLKKIKDRRIFQIQNHRCRGRETVSVKNNKNLHKIAGRSRSRSRSPHSRHPAGSAVINPLRLELKVPFLYSQDHQQGEHLFAEDSIFTQGGAAKKGAPLRRSQRLFHHTTRNQNPSRGIDDNFSHSQASSKYFTRNSSNSESIIREINEKHSQLELNNLNGLNIRPNWNFNCKLRASISQRLRFNECEKLTDRIARFALIVDAIATGSGDVALQEELNERKHSIKKRAMDRDESNNPPKKYFVSPSKWVYVTPPGRRVDMSKLMDRPTIQPAVIQRGDNTNRVFRLDDRFTDTDLVERYARNGEVPINERFMNLEGKFSVDSFLSERGVDSMAMVDLTLEDNEMIIDRAPPTAKNDNPKINIESVVVIKRPDQADGGAGAGTSTVAPDSYRCLSEHFQTVTCRPSKTVRKRILRAPLVDMTNRPQAGVSDEALGDSFTFLEPNDDPFGSARKTDDFDYRKSRKALFEKFSSETDTSFEEDYNN